MKSLLNVFLSSVLFGVGLLVSGMTDPMKVIGFLDVTGDWDPSLAFVMGGAVVVHTLAYRWVHRRKTPWFGGYFGIPSRRDVDVRLLIGSALFGAGWGLAGYCPGPAIVSASGGQPDAVLFVAAMVGGMLVFHLAETLLEERHATREEVRASHRP